MIKRRGPGVGDAEALNSGEVTTGQPHLEQAPQFFKLARRCIKVVQ